MGWVAATLPAVALLASTASGKPLPTDDRVLSGKLDNGVTWKYRQHDNPPGKMGIMIHIDTGSLNEKDSQRGLAHFIEHMCFNGSENFAPGELIPYFESIGMEFGADLNAFTSFDQTAYMLYLPDTTEGQIDNALKVLSDYAFRVTMPSEEIEKERGVILEESRSRKSAFQRVRDKLWPELFEGTRFATRMPIGDEEVIATAPREVFVDYYKTWYRPERVTVVLVGDSKPDNMIPLVKKWFGEFKSEAPARKEMGPEFKSFTERRTMVVTDPELASCSIQMLNIRPGRPPTVETGQWRQELVEHMGSWMLNRRYDDRVKRGIASYRGAGGGVSNFFDDALLTSVSASGEAEDWSKMLDELVVELSRAREHGFTNREMSLANKELMASAERAVQTEPTTNARRILSGIVSAVNDGVPLSSASQELKLFQEYLPTITLPEVNAVFRKHFEPGTYAYVVQMSDKESDLVPTRDEVMATVADAWAKKTDPIHEEAAATSLLAKLPKPCKVTEQTLDDDLKITDAWLDNGVRVHHRYMDYKKDAVTVTIALAGGDIEEKANNLGVTQVASLIVSRPATTRLTSSQVRDLMTGKNVSVHGGGGGDAFTIRISGTPEDLEHGLQLANALLTSGTLEQSAFDNWKKQTLQGIVQREAMPQFKAVEALRMLTSGGDPRQTFLTKKNVEALSVDQGQAWFNRIASTAPVEVSVVGDMKLDKALPLVQKYIGSLPRRARSADNLDKLRKLARETGPLQKHISVETITPQAMAFAGFMGAEGRQVQHNRALKLASNILTSRLVKRIREELAIVYSIRGSHRPSWIYEDSGIFAAGAPCDPDNAAQVVSEVHKILKAFGDTGPTQEELDNAKKQIINNLDTDMREPRTWSSILSHFDLHHRKLKDLKNLDESYQSFTAEQVVKVFKQYYTPERQLSVTAVPTTPGEKKSESEPAS